jgi:hypothetical protein
MGLSLARSPGVQCLVEWCGWCDAGPAREPLRASKAKIYDKPPNLMVIEVRPEVRKKVT